LRQSQRQPVILEGELPGGEPRERVSATGCPGVAASSPILLHGADRAAGQPWRLQIRDREVSDPQLALANAALLSSAVRAEAVIPPPSGEKLEQEPTYECGSGGWPGPHFFSY